MKKFLLAMFVVTFVISPSLALAQTDLLPRDSPNLSPKAEQKIIEPITIATVNIRDANIKKQNGNTLNISFALTNRVGFQPQVRYAVDILAVKENGLQILVDRKVYDETLALNEGERVEKEITYTAPEYLNGTYQVWIASMNAQSMPFAQALAGEVSFSGAGEAVSIDQDTCRVFVSDKPDEYFIDQGVDISKEESLKLTCAVANNTNSAISVAPYFRTHYRSSLGAVVSKESGKDAILLQGKERKNVSIALPIANEPQAYDVVVFFVDASGKQISSAVNTHYVLRGASATIQSIVFDKDYYAKGDTAKVSLFWTGAADTFPDARGEGTTIGPIDISAVISNAAGKECGSVLSKEDVGGVSTINTPIVIDCASPIVSLSVTDKTGKVLAQSQFGVQTKTQTKTVGAGEQDKNNTGREGIFIVVLIASLLFVIAFFFYQKRKSNASTQILTLAFLLSGILFTFSTAHADTFFVGYDGVFTVNLNKDVYAPGEAIHVTGSGTGGICGNGRQALALYTWNNQPPQIIFPDVDDKGVKYGDPNNPNDPLMFSNHSYKIQTVYSTKNFIASTVQGPYKVSFTGVGRGDLPGWPGGHGPLVTGFAYLSYSVASSPVNSFCGTAATSGIPLPSKPTTNLCSPVSTPVVSGGGISPWTWTCLGTNGGANSPICTAHVLAACGTANAQTLSSAPPITSLCLPSRGTPSIVSGPANGPWAWSCSGSNGGATNDDDISCYANTSFVCPKEYTYGTCQCPAEIRDRYDGCGVTEHNFACDTAGKNSCRDFNYREVAP